MLRSISKTELAFNADIIEQVWRFRHAQFVERLHWEDIRREDGREIDAFDGDDAVHLPLIVGADVVGYSRLLPTNQPHLLSDVYPELMGGEPWPRGPTIFEWTRCIAAENAKPIGGVAASNALMTAVVEYCLIAGISALIVETHPKLVNLLMTTGWEITPLAAPSLYKDSLLVPIKAVPTVKTLIAHHECYNINGSLIDLAGSERNPLRADEPLRQLPYLQQPHAATANAGLRRVS